MKRKMSIADFESCGIQYHSFMRVKNRYGLRGWRYVLCNPLTPDQKRHVLRWENTTIGNAINRYASEIRYDTIIIWDKCLTVLNSDLGGRNE